MRITGTLVRGLFVLLAAGFVASCAHRPVQVEFVDFDQQLATVASLHNSRQYEALKTHFADAATIRLPATPRTGNINAYIEGLEKAPYTINFGATEVVYSMPGRATTRSTAAIHAPARLNLQEKVTIDWVLDDGYWKIARIAVADWSPIIGTWRRGSVKGEGSLELRIQPGGTYQLYVKDDFSMPAFKGTYTLEGNKITFTDTSSYDGSLYQPVPGSYLFLRTSSGLNFRRINEENTWRSERFDGDWMAAR